MMEILKISKIIDAIARKMRVVLGPYSLESTIPHLHIFLKHFSVFSLLRSPAFL